ncbi:hypothetical protein ACTNEN_12185 [Oribacterium sp. HCP28S3_H8]
MLENKKSAGMRLFRHFLPTEMPEEPIILNSDHGIGIIPAV